MDFGLIIGLAKWFLLRQIEKYVEKIDWNKVAGDFVDRIGKMIPKTVWGDVERMNTMSFITDFGKSYDARGIDAMYGSGQFMAAFEGCFGDTDAAKLTASQAAYLASVKPKPVTADKPKEEIAGVKPKEEKGGFLSGKGKGKPA